MFEPVKQQLIGLSYAGATVMLRAGGSNLSSELEKVKNKCILKTFVYSLL